ncbi:MAG: substrate-binding domain-containing protein [Paraprevotella sp.]|nr:substrate-binding domain-containing protein [Paraprevotella sp.]
MKNILFVFFVLLLCNACRENTPHYIIGVSQCSDDAWRTKMNREMHREARLYDDVKVEIRSADDSHEKQKADIEYFIEEGVNLLVVAPNEAATITPMVEKAYDKGLPVVVVDRKILSDKYTAYVGADNYEIGRAAGEYIANLLKGKGTVAEISGLVGSSSAIDRHQGFMSAMAKHPGMKLVYETDAGWSETKAESRTDSLLKYHPHINLIFAHNDRMAMGAYQAWKKSGTPRPFFIGIDALPGKHNGVECVLDRTLDATLLYPTGGEKVMRTAMNILTGKPYPRETILSTAVVDRTNAHIIKLQTEKIDEQSHIIESLNTRIARYLTNYTTQRNLFYASLAVLCLLTILALVIFRAYKAKKRINTQLARQRDQMIGLSRQLEEATQTKLVFFTNISHDFRTPLSLITAPVEQLLQENELNDKQRNLMHIIQRNVHILLRLVNQILDFRKYENGKLELNLSRVDLKEQIEEWNNAFLAISIKKHIRFAFKVEEDDYRIPVDVEKIERVYFNLMSNAFKFTPENGSVTTSLRIDRPANCVCLCICDTGKGIPAGQDDKIFERFYQADAHTAGSGIGLALVKAFIELHDGQITAENRPQGGACFTVRLPLQQARYREQAAGPAPVSSHPNPALSSDEIGKIITVENEDTPASATDENKDILLVIDDNADIRNYVKVLMSERYAVLEAADGQTGLNLAMKYVPNVIICDVMMPAIDGMECCRRLKSEMQTCHIPIILLTACTQDEQRIEGFECGADSYISKPFNPEVLKVRVKNLTENRKRMKQFFGDHTTLAKESISELDKGFIERLKKLIEEHLSDSGLNVEELGRSMGLSRVQLYRKVKAITNYAPNELLRISRLKKAASLLASSEKTVAEIAYEVGFTSPSYLTKCFKEYFGESPKEYVHRMKS